MRDPILEKEGIRLERTVKLPEGGYDGLGVKEALRERYPAYSQKRDADLLRSEHIPFNLLAPLAN